MASRADVIGTLEPEHFKVLPGDSQERGRDETVVAADDREDVLALVVLVVVRNKHWKKKQFDSLTV